MSNQHFSKSRKTFHWVVAAVLLLQVPFGWYMVELPDGPQRMDSYSLHKAFGMVIFTIAVLRLICSLFSSRPPQPAGSAWYEKALSKAVQIALYVIVCLMPLSGWLMSSAAGYPVSMFGLFELPQIMATDKTRIEGFAQMHEMQSWILLGALTLHLLGALQHHFLLKDNVLLSMLPGRRN